MAGSQPDVINATFDVAYGVVGPIVDSLVYKLKFVRQCSKECRDVGEALEQIQPSLANILAHHKQDFGMKKWLDAVKKCIEDASVVLQKCETESSIAWSGIDKVKYGSEVLKLCDHIKELVNKDPLLFVAPKCSSFGIMQDVSKKIFGMEDHFKRVKSFILKGHYREGNNCIAIQGRSGAGKTLLAQMVNNDKEIQEMFGKDFLIWITVGRDANIPKIYNQMRNCLKAQSNGGSLEDQRIDLMNAFASTEALLILDDVWDSSFYETKEMVYWLNIAKGSMNVTLITTCDELVTSKCVNAGEEIILRLSHEHSWQLFCTYAFGTDTPILDKHLEGLARDACEQCNCLPLALKVIACAMKEKSDWKRMLRHVQASNIRTKNIEQEIFEPLRFSYDQLDGPTKICFLYFAAFPEDYEIRVELLCQILVVEALFGEELSEDEAMEEAQCVVNELIRRSLIEVTRVDGGGKVECVKMHDILRDLANQLASEGNECERENLFKMEKNDIEEFPRAWVGYEMKVKRLSLMGKKMKIFPNGFLAPNLKICILHGIQWPHTDLDDMNIGLHDCKLEEVSIGNLPRMKFLHICDNPHIKQLSESMGGLRCLQYLNLLGCIALKKLPERMDALESLQHLNLSGCRALEQLPKSMGALGSLQHVNLSQCSTLKQLPKNMGALGSLQHLDLSSCRALEQLPESMGRLGSLQYLNLSDCKALEQLPESMGQLESLQHLDLSSCRALEQLPESMGQLGSLQHLDLSGCKALEQLPESTGRLGSLQHLDLSGCKALEQLPESMGQLGSLQHLDLSGCKALEQLPQSMGGLKSLQHLNLSKCSALKQLPESMGILRYLQHLNLSWCSALEQVPESMGSLRSLEHLNLSSCNALDQVPESIGGLGSLQHLDLSECDALEHFPESIGQLEYLQHLDLSWCCALEHLPESIGQLEYLQHLDLSGCYALEELPESMGGLKSLQYLDLESCSRLEQVPESLGRLGSLQHLNLSECRALARLPESMGGLRSLQHLNLSRCYALKEIPESMGGLESLESLDLSRSYALEHIPESMRRLRSLQRL